jgi:Uroporphyrinogen decarboxylase (URO-D)
MTSRERFLATFRFEPVDRPFVYEWGPWGVTLERWKNEGMEGDWPSFLAECDPQIGVPINFGPLPVHEYRVVAEDDRSRTYVDDRGITRRELKERSETSMPDFVDYPLKSRRDWEEDIAFRYDPDTPGRLPDNWADLVREWRDREAPLSVTAYPHLGMFGPIRDLMGVETMLPMMYDDPKLIRDIARHWGDFHYRLLERMLADIVPDCVNFWEDMAFHSAPLISPRMFLDFFGAEYRRINDMLIEAGVPVRGIDSDGDSRQLIGPFLRCGINYLWPLEAAAHMDVADLRARYGKQLLMHGNIDKRAIAAGPPVIDRELEAKIPVALAGGYLPTCDHSMPPDISWANVSYYWRRKKELLGIKIP